MPFRNELIKYARQNSLDPYVVAGLIRQESEFNPKAVSRAKAYGLTQVLPSTGRQLARQEGIRHFSASMLFQPPVNLRLGTMYLKRLLDQWDGKWEPTLASYNAGKSRVDRWITWNGYEDPAEFVETIPFTETREYVQAVLRNAAFYRRLYGEKALHP
jgi:soluble lytic murein transglycosylase